MTFASLFGPITTSWPHPDEVAPGVTGYTVDPLAWFVRDWMNDKVTFYEGMRRPATVLDVSRLRSGFVSSVRVRDEVDGAEFVCRRMSANHREKLVRQALPPGHYATSYVLKDAMWSSTPRYFSEVLGLVMSDDEVTGYAMAARVQGVDVAAMERALSNMALGRTAESRRRVRHLDWRMGVHRALRLEPREVRHAP